MTDRRPTNLCVRGVRKAFSNGEVLRGVDLDVESGTIAAVLGPSGCGKTTLLRVIAGFEQPDAGSVAVAGQTVIGDGRTVPAHRRRIGLMPQEGALFPHLSVAGNIAYGLERKARSEASARVRHWLDVVGLLGLADARPHELSGGQQQRVALARALAAEPSVILLDEPFAALDAELRQRVREDIATILRAAHTTAVLVTHDQSEALSLADTVALLIDGAIVQAGPPSEVYRRPATLAAARFVGDTVELTGEAAGAMVHTALGPLPTESAGRDGPVVAVLRPEQLRVADSGQHRTATVLGYRFYGAHSAIRVALTDGTSLTVRCAGDACFELGQVIGVQACGQVLAYPLPRRADVVPLG